MLHRICLLLCTLALASCATSTLDAQTKAALRTVYVEVQLPKPAHVVPIEGGALAVAYGKTSPIPGEAADRFDEVVVKQVGLSAFIRAQATQELRRKGYQVTEDASQSDARVRFIVYHGLGVASVLASDRGVAMTVNLEVVRNPGDKRVLFAIANTLDEPERKRLRTAPAREWFNNDALIVEQYHLVAKALTVKALSGM